MKRVLATLFLALLARPAAAITVDGTVDAAYGPARAVQQVQTQFGDASPPGSLGGSELDAAYARVSGGRLYLMLTGNHEPNFNKLEVFIDSIAGGENKLTGTPAYDYFNGSTWISTNLAGLNFDTDFAADYHLFSRWGGGPGPYEVDFVKRNNGIPVKVPGSNGVGGATVGLISSGSIAAGTVGPNASAASLTQPLDFAINNNNAAGVTGGSGAADPVAAAAVTTGMEFSIALADLGSPGAGAVIKISAMINNGDHNYLSNQVLGGLPAGSGNLGGNGGGGFTGNLSGVDFRQFNGLQYFTVAIPEPSALLLGVVAATGLAARRRKV